jgi:hypothetical protein
MSTHHHASFREEPVARITRKLSDCEDRTCPALWETDDPELTGIQGALPAGDDLGAAGEIPAHEGILFVPTALLHAWASRQR